MKITNIHGLPEALVKAASFDQYVRVGDVSATGFNDPVRKTILTRRHYDDLTEDVSTRLWAILGKAVHRVFNQAVYETDRFQSFFWRIKSLLTDLTVEQFEGTNAIPVDPAYLRGLRDTYQELPFAEKRLAIHIIDGEVKPIDLELAIELTDKPHEGIIVSGQADLVEPGTKHISDVKAMQVWAHIYQSSLQDWRTQLSIYKLIYDLHGIPIETGSIIEILRDHHDREVGRSANYPEVAMYEVPIEFIPEDELLPFMIGKGTQIMSLLDAPQKELPLCTNEERWWDPPTYAVTKLGAKRATKNFKVEKGQHPDATRQEAELFLHAKGPAYFIEERPPRYKRCEKWCSAASVCEQWAADQKEAPE